MLQVATILIYISYFSVLIPIFFLLRKKQNFGITPIRILGLLLFASGFADLGSYILIKLGQPSLTVTNIYVISQFYLLSYIYFYILKNKKLIYFGLIIFTVFTIINTSIIQPINTFQSWSRLVGGIIILSYSVSYYRQMLKVIPPITNLLHFSPFWLNTAVYFYFAFNLFLFALSNYMFKNLPADVSMVAYSFHNFNNTVKNILFMVAICYVKVKEKQYDTAAKIK